MLSALLRSLSSLRLTVFLLSASLVLVFFGTLDQVQHGIYFTQQKYFEHLVAVYSLPPEFAGGHFGWVHLPLPGGYLLGPLLVLNLICAHFRYYRAGWRKFGIALIHLGVVALLLGQLVAQIAQRDNFLWLGEGQSSRYVESFHYDEFVLIDHSAPEQDTVYAWSVDALRPEGARLRQAALPFEVEVLAFYDNASLFPKSADARFAELPLPYDRGIGVERQFMAVPIPVTRKEGERNRTSAVVRLHGAEGVIGTWLVSNVFRDRMPVTLPFGPQEFEYQGRRYSLSLRFARSYMPSRLELVDFRHEKYPGTNIPFNFSSAVRVVDPATGAGRDSLIYMNHPLRDGGLTFYQASFANQDTYSMFQVVENPGRWIPYYACAIVTAGLLWQFLASFLAHLRRKPAAQA